MGEALLDAWKGTKVPKSSKKCWTEWHSRFLKPLGFFFLVQHESFLGLVECFVDIVVEFSVY